MQTHAIWIKRKALTPRLTTEPPHRIRPHPKRNHEPKRGTILQPAAQAAQLCSPTPQTLGPSAMAVPRTVTIEILLNARSATPEQLPPSQLSLLHTAIERALPDPVATCALPIPAALSPENLRCSEGVVDILEMRATLNEDDYSQTCPKWDIKLVLHHYTHSSVSYQAPIGASAVALPSSMLEKRWESLHFSQPLKSMTLSYVTTRMRHGYLPSSGFILLHGAPGSGKSTLAEAVAHKACTRLGQGVLLRLTHGSLSKYFGESANRVGAVFQWAAKQECVVVIIIDEIESFGLERGQEGGDIRVTNALLTGLDVVRRFSHVAVIGTSNCVDRVDGAIRDRADLSLRVLGMDRVGVETVLRRYLEVLVCRGLLELVGDIGKVVEMCDGLSGRRVEGCVLVAVGLVERLEWGEFEKALRKAILIAKGVDP